jgi:peptide deformylase
MEITYVKPHAIQSVEVTEKDHARVFEIAEEIFKLSRQAHGIHKSAYAIAHSQVDDKKPLRFFVTHNGDVFINPVITRHTRTTVDRMEGCMSFPNTPPARVQRFNKIEVEYQHFHIAMPKPWVVSEKKFEALSGLAAQVIQHEYDHFEGKYVHPIPQEVVEASANK